MTVEYVTNAATLLLIARSALTTTFSLEAP
jgi:hypothetical protein